MAELDSQASLSGYGTRRHTLFVSVPFLSTVSLKGLDATVTVREIREKLELHAGLPCQIYGLRLKQHQQLAECDILEFGNNVHDGAILKVEFHPQWKQLFQSIQNYDRNSVLKLLADIKQPRQFDQEGKDSDAEKDYHFVALYLTTYKGTFDVCKSLYHKGKPL